MIPLQEIEISTDKNISYYAHIEAHSEGKYFISEVVIHCSLDPCKYSSCGHQFSPLLGSPGELANCPKFNTAKDAFIYALKWIIGDCAENNYTIEYINNPCNCEFLSRENQLAIVNDAGLKIPIRVNGE